MRIPVPSIVDFALLLSGFLFGSFGIVDDANSLWIFVGILLLCALRRAQLRRGANNTDLFHIATISIFWSCIASDVFLRTWPDLLGGTVHERLVRYSESFVGQLRYLPNQRYEETVVGDLISMGGDPAVSEPRNIRFSTDDFGFRNLSSQPSYSLLAVGDSFGVGIGTTDEQIWPRLLEKDSGRSTYNLSFPGSPGDEVAVLEAELPRLHLEPASVLIWLIFSGNDLNGMRQSLDPPVRSSKLTSMLTTVRNFRLISPLHRLLQRFGLKGSTRQLVHTQIISDFGPALVYSEYETAMRLTKNQILESAGWREIELAILRMNELSKRYEFSVLVVFAPSKEEIYGTTSEVTTAFDSLLHDEVSKHNFSWLNLRPEFQKTARELLAQQRKLLWWSDDTHWNELGHKLTATLIAEMLKPKFSNVPN